MNKKNEARLNMYHAVVTFCDNNPAIITTIPAFNTALTAFKAKLSSISSAIQAETLVIIGVTTDKSHSRKNLVSQGAEIAATVFAFAASTGNNELKQQVNFTPSELLRLKDELLAPTCLNIHDAADTNLAALNTYGITAATLTSFKTTITNYKSKVPAPRNAKSLRSAYIKNLNLLFTEANNILKYQMDKIAMQFKSTQPEFYNTYKNNRNIIDAAIYSTQLSGTVINSITNKPISEVKVQVINQPYSITTDANGKYTLKIPVVGVYKIMFTHAAHPETITENIKITLGKTTTLNTALAAQQHIQLQ